MKNILCSNSTANIAEIQILQEPAFDGLPHFSHSGQILDNCDLNRGQGVIIPVFLFSFQHKMSLLFRKRYLTVR